MQDTITIVGNVATDPTLGQTATGIPVANFRLASTHRRFDEATQTWVDVHTNWFSVAAFRQLADNVKASVRSGDRIIVTGRMKIRPWENNGKRGTSVDIDADAIGHDLRWGTSVYRRTARAAGSDSTPSASPAEPSREIAENEPEAHGEVDLSWAAVDQDAVYEPAEEVTRAGL